MKKQPQKSSNGKSRDEDRLSDIELVMQAEMSRQGHDPAAKERKRRFDRKWTQVVAQVTF